MIIYLFGIFDNYFDKTSVLFTKKALKRFLKNNGFQYVIRAHECQVILENNVKN